MKPKPELADTFGDMVTDTETTFQKENLYTDLSTNHNTAQYNACAAVTIADIG